MRIYKKYLSAALLLIFSLGIGCKKEKRAIEVPENVLPPIIEVGAKIFIPVQLGTGKSKTMISYTADQSLSKIEYEDGRSTVLTYNETGKPEELQRYKGEELISSTSYELNEKGQVIKGITSIIKRNNYILTGYYDLRYNSTNQLVGISYFDKQLVDEQERWYNEAGNLSGEKGIVAGSAIDYSYDSKNGLFKHAGYVWLLAIEKESSLFLSAINNVQHCNYPLKPERNQDFSYVYNVDDYPETINTVVNGIKTAVKVVYKQIN